MNKLRAWHLLANIWGRASVASAHECDEIGAVALAGETMLDTCHRIAEVGAYQQTLLEPFKESTRSYYRYGLVMAEVESARDRRAASEVDDDELDRIAEERVTKGE